MQPWPETPRAPLAEFLKFRHPEPGATVPLPGDLPRKLLVVLASSLVVALASCGDDGLGKRYSVSGTVNYQAKPLEKGEISFVPVDPAGHAAFGKIEAGSYSLSTIGDGDGALPGKYKVTIIAKDNTAAQAEEKFKAANTKGIQTGIVPKEFQGKAAKLAKNHVPAKYSTADTSGLEAEVKESSNSFPFDLVD